MSNITRFILITPFVVAVGVFIFSTFAIGAIFDFGDEKVCSKNDLISNYKNNKLNIDNLKQYYNQLVPADKIVEIELKNRNEIDRLAVQT